MAESLGMDITTLTSALEGGGLSLEEADRAIENVVGLHSLPFAVATRFVIDGVARLVPMAVEEPSVVAAASGAAKRVAAGGGFEVEADPPITTAQVELHHVTEPAKARAAIASAEAELLDRAGRVLAGLRERGGGLREIEVRDLGEGTVVVHLHVDCRDAMGANLVNTLAEALGPRLAQLAHGQLGLRIVTNLADRRRVRVRARVPAAALAETAEAGAPVRDAIVRASHFAERDPYRAVTHNKGVMNGVDAVVVATGNDWRAVEAGAHAWAAGRGPGGAYGVLCRWRTEGDDLVGQLELPLALGIVGGIGRLHRAARLAIALTGAKTATELAGVAAAAGMACNLAATRALVTEGIQRGHMALHARSVAAAAGARGTEVDEVARRIHAAGRVTLPAAHEALDALRRPD